MSLNHASALTKTYSALSHITVAYSSLTNTPLSIPSSEKNTTVAIIPTDHLLCQPQIYHAVNPLLCSHPLHPCLFQCASYPLNRMSTAFLDTLASARMMPFEWAKLPKKVQELLSPPLTPGVSPSLPPLCRMSLLPHLTCPWTNSGPLSLNLLPQSGSEMMSIRRRLRTLRPILQHFNKGWMMKTMASANVRPDIRRIESTFQTSLFPSMMGPNDLPALLSSLTIEGWQGYIVELKERRR